MKEMVGGCCVCSDERGWPENPLVYCDGQNCTVAVHQACYGIVTVPTGPWFCRKCESQERAARVRCELCPSRDGALKKTDNQGWAHVVCALYIPEVRFGNVTTMEPIILQLIPQERYSKTCYICQEIGKGSKAHVGACMQCNKSGCKQQFHVTCAQALGLLCEEAGNYLDNVKYCGYCQHHYSKLKKGGNVKTIPPYKPVANETGSSDPPSSPEKESETLPSSHHNTASTSASLKLISHGPLLTTASNSSNKLRKCGNVNKFSANILPTSGAATSPTNSLHIASPINASKIAPVNLKDKDNKHNKVLSKIATTSKPQEKEKGTKNSKNCKESVTSEQSTISIPTTTVLSASPISSANSDVADSLHKDSLGQKFTTSNFTQTIVVNSESVFGSDNNKIGASILSVSTARKRKVDNKPTSTIANTEDITKDLIKDVSVTLVPLPIDRHDGNDDKSSKKQKTDFLASLETTKDTNKNELNQSASISQSNNLPVLKPHSSWNKLSEAPCLQSSSPSSTLFNTQLTSTVAPSLVVSVPLSNANVPGVNLPASGCATIIQLNQNMQNYQSVTSLKEPLVSTLCLNPIVNAQPSQNSAIQSPHSPLRSSTGPVQVTLPTTSLIDSTVHAIPSEHNSSNLQYSNNITQNISPQPNYIKQNISTLTPAENDSGNICKTRQQNQSMQSDDQSPEQGSCTPENLQLANSFGGLKFGYEAQAQPTTTSTSTSQPQIKDSPPSSPGSEAGSRKQNQSTTDTKDFKIFQNGVHATHMLGNQLNPASSVAQKMSDQLHMELEAHSLYTSSSLDSATQLTGPPFPGKNQIQMRNLLAQTQQQGPPSLSSMLGENVAPTAAGNTPQSLEQLLERQWEQGSQFLMEQAQHFDIASLLSCLHQLRTENVRLEDHVTNLVARRDHLLAVNARLAIPLNPHGSLQTSFNSSHINGVTDSNRTSTRSNIHHNFIHHVPIENGIDFRHATPQNPAATATTTRQSSTNLLYVSHSRQQSIVPSSTDSPRTRCSNSTYSTQTSYSQQANTKRDDNLVKPS